MTIVTTDISSGPYVAVASTTFPVFFQSGGAGEVEVTLDGVVQSTNLYTFVRDDDGTGEVIFTSPVTGSVMIYSNPDFSQQTSFSRFGAFFPDQINGPLDRAAVRDNFLRGLILPRGAARSERTNKYLAYDANGLPLYLDGTSSSATDGQLVSFQQAGAGAVARTSRDKLRERVSILDFGGVANATWSSGWSGTDNYAALLAAKTYLESVGGGTIHFPAGRYFFTAFPPFTATGIILEGDGWTENAGIAGASTYSIPLNYEGTILCAANDVPGPVFYGVSDAASAAAWAALPTDGTKFKYRSARGSGLRNLMLYGGGTSATAHGCEVRTIVEFDRVRIENFAEGLRIDASTHSEATAYGLADQAIFRFLVIRGNRRHGLRVRGNDANVILFDTLDAANNGGCGVLEQGQLGNTYLNCHFASNNQATGATRTALQAEVPALLDDYVGAFVNTSTIGAHLLLGCYAEVGLGGLSHIITPAMILGGNLASDANLTPASTAFSLNGAGNIERGVLRAVNRSSTRVGGALGGLDARTAFSFGADQDAAGDGNYRDIRLTYNFAGTDKWWGFYRAGAPTASTIQFPGSGSTSNNGIDAPAFPNGFFLGGDGFGTLVRHAYATAMPSTGTWARGSFVWNTAPALSAGKVLIGWTRLITGAAHVLNTDWAACHVTNS